MRISLMVFIFVIVNSPFVKLEKKGLPKEPLLMSELDVERLYDQWEEADEEKLPEDKSGLPQESLQSLGSGDPSDLLKDPEKLMIASKKGKTVMAFVSVANKPSKQETEKLTERWQVGLTNNHMRCQRFVIADDRAIFVFEDGALAFEAKDFLLEQPELKDYTIDNRVWHGKGYPVESAREEL